jgi:hypothetical protein
MGPKLYDHALKSRVPKRNLYAAADSNERLQVSRHEVCEYAIEVARENDVSQRRIS